MVVTSEACRREHKLFHLLAILKFEDLSVFNCSDGVVPACLNLISQMLTGADFRLSLSIQQYFSTAHAMQSPKEVPVTRYYFSISLQGKLMPAGL